MTTDASAQQPAHRFGTFLGVFTPSVLTILGLIMYLRFGWVVGNLGLPVTLLVVVLASSITFITALSASAVATNMKVGVGGEYYMISRSLGLELGGAIGMPLFLCRTLSITFYSFGLVEAILAIWPSWWGEIPSAAPQLMAATIIVIITLVSGKSAAFALKLQIPIMVAVGASMVALAIGALADGTRTPEFAITLRTAPEGFWYVFAVFFPAVTGFTAGIGMSGDLKDPRHSIPRGSLAAVAAGTAVYLLVPVLMAVTTRISPEELAVPGVAVWTSIAIFGPWLVFPGLWGAVLSSAFGSVLGGPRVLQALAADGLAPSFLARLSRTGQPTIATWVSGAIALAAVTLGGLNAVAQFVTILFLTIYVTINFAAALETLVGDPFYRPTIPVPWYVSLLGSIGAIVVMFLISPWACLAAVVLEIALYVHLRRRAMRKRWGDVRAGVWVVLARWALLKLRHHELDPRNWRPQILLFAGDAGKRAGLVRLASWFNQDRGVVTVCRLVVGALEKVQGIDQLREEMDHEIKEAGVVAFPEVNVVSDFENGVFGVAQANGIGGLHSNTVMFGWSRRKERLESQLRMMRGMSHARKNTIITKLNWGHEPGRRKRIDIWWGGMQNNGDLMLLLAYLLRLNPGWTAARICVRSVAHDEEERRVQLEGLAKLLPEIRIGAESEVIVKPVDRSITEVLHQTSANADIVFLGLQEPEPGEEAAYADRIIELAGGLNTCIFVRSAGEFAGHLV
jgi:amino acid transporter